MNHEYIVNCLKMCEEHINEGGGKITNPFLISYVEIPSNVKELIKENYKVVKKIIEFYYTDFKYKASKSKSFDDALCQIEFIKNKSNDKKTLLIIYNDIIFPWLLTTQFFTGIYEAHSPSIINPSDIQPIVKIDKFIPRENQKEAFDALEENGLVTGIHCQATGCGKSYIIIRYIDYVCRTSKKPNPKVILFTERVNILSDLFSFTKGKLEADPKKIEYWKKLGVGDLTKYNIINRVTNKDKKWDEEFKKSNVPTLLVINRAFLTLGKKYNSLTAQDIDLILHDECHNTTSDQCHMFLKQAKKLNIKIVGFSATPLRTGKYDKTKLLEIYAKHDNQNDLNLLTNYNMIYAISKNLILPPEFYWYQIETYEKKENDNDLIFQEEIGSVFEMLNYIVPSLPNKKIIAWCGTIEMAKIWKQEIEKTYRQRANLKNFMFGIDTSTSGSDDYDNFSKLPKNAKGEELKLEDLGLTDRRRMYYGSSILFCAAKHREGSDIKYLDGCIFLDKVKERGAIPFIQSVGRALRLCPETENKTKGIIIDGFVKDTNGYEKQFVDKIIGYYMALENITDISDDKENKFEQYVKMMDIVNFDKEKEVINMKLGNNIIKIHCNKLEWENIISKFQTILDKKMNITPEEAFELHINKIKTLEPFKNPENDFWEEYKKLDHDKLGLPVDIYEPYKNIWETKTWYDLLGFKDRYSSLNDFKLNFTKKYPGVKEMSKSIYNKVKNEFNLPNHPLEYYRTYKIDDYKSLL